MTKEEIIGLCGRRAREVHIRDSVCSRSVLLGLQAYFDIPDELIRISSNLCGGAGASSGSCGAYTCGLLAVGLKYNAPLEEELKDPSKFDVTHDKFTAFRDRFIAEFGTTLCPEIHKQVYGRSYIFTNPEDCEEYFNIPHQNEIAAGVVERATRLCAAFLLEDETL